MTVWPTGVQERAYRRVPDHRKLHGQRQEELPAPRPPHHGLHRPLQAGKLLSNAGS